MNTYWLEKEQSVISLVLVVAQHHLKYIKIKRKSYHCLAQSNLWPVWRHSQNLHLKPKLIERSVYCAYSYISI